MDTYKIAIFSILAVGALAAAPVAHAQSVVIESLASYPDEFDTIVQDQDDPIAQDNDVIDFDGDAIVTSQFGMDRCTATFRSFDPTTGTYTGYDGLKRMCPYLE